MQSAIPYIIYLHSILRYFLLFFAVLVSLQCLMGIMGKKTFTPAGKTAALLLLISCDLQLLLGLALYFGNGWAQALTTSGVMKNAYTRFYAVEHSVGMIVAIILVHVGYSVVKKNIGDERKFKRLFWCSFTALTIFMAMIPWSAKQAVGRPNIPHLHS